MVKKVEVEAKNQNDALKKAQELLNVSPDKIVLTIIKEKRGILGIGASTTYEATVTVDLLEEGRKYLVSIIESLNIEAKTESRKINDKEFYFRVESSENALLIGKEGKTLINLQLLLKIFLNTLANESLVITLDIGNYSENRKKQLEILATKTAKQVAFTKKEVKLPNLNAFDRRIVHTKLAEWRDVVTESIGEGEERCLVIKPKSN